MPAAEMMVQPVYAKHRQMIADACFAAGKEAVERGKINPVHMQVVSFPGVTRTPVPAAGRLLLEHARWKSLLHEGDPVFGR